LCGLAASERRPVYSRDLHKDPRCTLKECKDAGLRSFAALPLFGKTEVDGVISLASFTKRDFQKESVFIETISSVISIVMANSLAGEALLESEERFRKLADAAPIAISIIGNDGAVEYVNRRHFEIMGYTVEEVPTLERWWTLAYPDEKMREKIAGEWRVVLERISRGEKIGNIVRRVICKDGAMKDVELRITPAAGKIIVAFDDITERRRMEDLLRHAMEDWEGSFNTIHDAITIHDTDFNITRANKAAEDLLGLPFLTISRKKCYESYHGTGCPPEGCPGCVTLKTGKVSSAEMFEPYLNKYIEVKAFPRFDQNGSLTGLIHVVRNISERKLAEEALISAEKKFRNLLETVQLAAVMLDQNGNITFLNDYLLGLTGWSRDEVLNKNWFDLFIPEDMRASMRSLFKTNMETETMLHGENHIVSRNGSLRLIVWDTVVLRGAEGNAIGTASIGIDVTEHRKLEDQLLQSQKMEAIGQLAGGVAHDFNNILSAIVGYASLSLMGMSGDDLLRGNIEQILNAAERATTLTQSLLAFSRKQVMNPKPNNLNNIVKKMEALILRLIREDIEITTTVAENDLTIFADSGQIEQILMNLVTNARDAMPKGGNILIRTASVNMDREFVAAHGFGKEGRYGLLAVSDTGEGISAETKERIFEPFFTTKEQGKGTGLGLSMVYGIVKQHDGYIDVYSEQGRGTTFKIYLPLFRGFAAEKDMGTKSIPLKGGSETVMVAEDDEQLRKFVATILSNYGYTVIEAVDGDDAVAKFSEHSNSIDLVVMDVVMPKKNGKEAYDEFRIIKPGVKAIFVSGYAEDIISKEGLLDPGIEFIPKPVSPSDLLKKVREVLDR
ncbi:MAG TPA: PAS domain S-box protein, partial [Thermodesulfovibrionales bacterium]|nr:PAS domain S-box protein [Thermodesulfovibrionales bacterium]